MLLVAAQLNNLLPPHHCRRVDDRAFDEDFATDLLVPDQPVQPLLVDAKTLSHLLPGKAFHQTADHADVGAFLQQCYLLLQALWVGQIVGVHARHEPPPAQLQTPIQSRNQSFVPGKQRPQPLFPPLPLFEDLPAAVLRAVIHRHDLELLQRLPLQTFQRLRQGIGGVVHRHQYGNGGFGHGGAPLTGWNLIDDLQQRKNSGELRKIELPRG